MLNSREITLNGVGFKCFYNLHDNFLLLQIGKSHYVKFKNNYKNLIIKTKKNKLLLLSNSNNDLGSFSAKLVSLKKPDSYKNIGVLLKNKSYRKKAGKKR